jgi:hypothetical protein
VATHRIPDHAEFVGEWFLPSSEEEVRKIPGTLSWSSQRASLELHDSFNPVRGAVYGDEVHTYPAVYGTTTKSEFVTVLEASRASAGLNIGPAGFRQPERLVSSWVVVGAHVDAQTLYSEIRVRIPGLQIWLCPSGVKQTILHKTKETAAGVIYRIEGLPEEESEISSLPATLGWGIDRNFSGDLITKISVVTSACLRIQTDTPQNLDWFFLQLGKATTLLAFLAGTPMAPDEVTAKVANSNISVSVVVALREANYCTHRNSNDFYMLRSNMDADLGVTFAKWFELYDNIAMPCQLALSVLSSENLWLHVEFLSLMQALEGFHRATMPGLYTSEANYEPVKQALSNAIPKTVGLDHKDALKSRIRYGNEVSLRKRLDALVSRLELPLRKHILGGDGVVPRRWVITRNYYTHWDEASRELTLDGIEMHRAGVRMRHLLRALYLDLVGIPQSAIAKSLQNACKESQYLIQLNNTEHRKNHPEADTTPMMHIGLKDAESPNESSG